MKQYVVAVYQTLMATAKSVSLLNMGDLFKKTGLRRLWLALLVFCLDIGIKLIVMNAMGYGWANRIELLPFFNLLYVHNLGAAFSFLSDQPGGNSGYLVGLLLL